MIYNLSHIFEGFQNRMKSKMKADSETNFTPEDAINFPVITTQDTGDKVMLKYKKFMHELGFEFTDANNGFTQFSIMKDKLDITLFMHAAYYSSPTHNNKMYFNFESYVYIQNNRKIEKYMDYVSIDLIYCNKTASEKNINKLSYLNFNKFLIILKNMKTTQFKSMMNDFYKIFYKYKYNIKNLITWQGYAYYPINLFRCFFKEYLFPEWGIKGIKITEGQKKEDMRYFSVIKNEENKNSNFDNLLQKYNLKQDDL